MKTFVTIMSYITTLLIGMMLYAQLHSNDIKPSITQWVFVSGYLLVCLLGTFLPSKYK